MRGLGHVAASSLPNHSALLSKRLIGRHWSKRLHALPLYIAFSAWLFGCPVHTLAAMATVDELSAVNAETILLRAQAAREQARAALIKAQRDMRAPVCTHAAPSRPEARPPQARRITDINGVREATLAYPDRQVEVREGDTLTGGYVVQRIRLHSSRVDLKNKAGRIIQIPLSGLMQPVTPAAPLPQSLTALERPYATAPLKVPPPVSAFARPVE